MLKLLSVFVVEDTFSEISDVGVTSRGVMRELICPSETVEVKVEVARYRGRDRESRVSVCTDVMGSMSAGYGRRREHGRSGNCHLGEFIICRTIYNHEKREQ